MNHEVGPTEGKEIEIESREVNHEVGKQREQNEEELTTGEREELEKIGEWEKEMEREENEWTKGTREDLYMTKCLGLHGVFTIQVSKYLRYYRDSQGLVVLIPC